MPENGRTLTIWLPDGEIARLDRQVKMARAASRNRYLRDLIIRDRSRLERLVQARKARKERSCPGRHVA